MVLKQASSRVNWMSVDFKGAHYPKSVILYAVYFHVRYGVSYRDLEEIMAERGADVDHATLNRWVIKFSPMIAANAQAQKRPTAISWRMDETYIKVKGRWTYYYRAVDKTGKALDFMLSERRDKPAARRFFKRAIGTNGVPDRVVIDKSGANLAGLESVNDQLFKSKDLKHVFVGVFDLGSLEGTEAFFARYAAAHGDVTIEYFDSSDVSPWR
jgi:transposase-like protein